ncbi:MAG: S41 family peptidase [Candidatus Eremiobacteraeota bacterium]|nr:S41 family peptidase [Candidatus Eremiobacteraeota bacterium]
MHSTIRLLIAAFLVAVAALGGALYLDHTRASGLDTFAGTGNGIASLDLKALLANPRAADQRMLDSAFRQVEKEYYRPVDAQVLLNGEQRELVAYLRKHKIASPSIPTGAANGDQSHDVRLLNRNLQLAQSQYGKLTSNAELTQAAIRGMLNALGDPYTTYLTPREISSLEDSLSGGDFGGIGVYIFQTKAKQVVVDPIDGMPAVRAGIKAGDQIIAVNGREVAGMSLDEVERLIRGPIGTVVRLTVKTHKASSSHVLPVTRQQIIVPSVKATFEDGFEYVRLADFGKNSYDEVRKALADGKARGAKGYILDLRNNGGGLLDAAVEISSLFVPESKTVVSTIDRAGVRETKISTGDALGASPLVVLVNKYTASASEITAGAIQDYHVGLLLGTKTFGKGVVQSIYKMSDGGALKITTARYVTPLGRDIHHKGIAPDVVVAQPVEAPIIDTPKDLQLAAAKTYLRRIARR